MDCDTVRQLLDRDEAAPELREHLERCAACRAEAEFGRQVVNAVAAIPRVPAPDGLLEHVMGAIRPLPAADRPPRRRALILQTWEIGWIGAACLLAVVLSSFTAWGAWGGALFSAEIPGRIGSVSIAGIQAVAWSWQQAIVAFLAQSGADPAVWGTLPWSWVAGAVGFALGLYLLLSWQGKPGGRDEWEDAHA